VAPINEIEQRKRSFRGITVGSILENYVVVAPITHSCALRNGEGSVTLLAGLAVLGSRSAVA
jgi:hypothetical protein